MKRLYLLRHAKSDWSQPGLADHDRPLNPRGERACRLLRGYMDELGIEPQVILCSTATRTRQTLAGTLGDALENGRITADVRYSERLYHADSHSLLEAVRGVEAGADHVMLVGHNPGLHDLAAMLAHRGAQDQIVALREKLPTGSLVVLDMDGLNPKHIMSGVATLVDFVRPKVLARAVAPTVPK